MLGTSTITKFRGTQISDLIIVAMIISALVIGGYNIYARSPQLKRAEFQATNLTITPAEAGVNQPITISVNVTNVGEETGNYSATLKINDVAKITKTIQLLGNESRIVEFNVTESNEGSYYVNLAGLNGTFIIISAPPPDVFKISDLIIRPYEGWVGVPINISVKVSNTGEESYSYSLTFRVNEVVRETKTIRLSAGETTTVNTTVTESSEGTYRLIVGGLSGPFRIVPTGKHTLIVAAGGTGGGNEVLPLTLDGVSVTAPYSELIDAGTHTIAVPVNYETSTAVFKFAYWGDGDTSATKTINLQDYLVLVVTYDLVSGYASCPSLFIWNGTSYVYRTEVSAGTGYLAWLSHFGENGTMVFGYADPWDYIKLDRNEIQPRNGYYDMTLTEVWDEIYYMDSARLLVVDHSPDVDVYSTMGTTQYKLEGQGTIYAVNKNPSPPASAFYGGENVLPQVSKLDGIYATQRDWKYGQWNTLELNLGDLSGAKEIKLQVAGMVVWPTSEVTTEWVSKFVDLPGEQPFPAQYMEVKDENGSWVRVPDNRQFPILDAAPETFVVNLTGLFPTNNYSLRINTFFDWRFDYIGVDTTAQQDVIIQDLYPFSATLTQIFETHSTSTGNFTRYGDVTELMRDADDKFVIGRKGDEIHLLFPANIEPVPENMERDYFLVGSCWFKLSGLPYLPFTVDPLPFHNMSAFPYPPSESYPYDGDHLSYLLEYNTRIITFP